jgi:hypothetical protein
MHPVYTQTRWQQLVTMTTVIDTVISYIGGVVMVSAMMVVWLRTAKERRRKQHCTFLCCHLGHGVVRFFARQLPSNFAFRFISLSCFLLLHNCGEEM